MSKLRDVWKVLSGKLNSHNLVTRAEYREALRQRDEARNAYSSLIGPSDVNDMIADMAIRLAEAHKEGWRLGMLNAAHISRSKKCNCAEAIERGGAGR